MVVSEAAKHINPDPARWVGLVHKAVAKWRGRVSEVCLEELHQVGLTRLYLESERWNGTGSWAQYATLRIQWSMLDWLRIEGQFTRGKNGKTQRVAHGKLASWKDHPELPTYIPVGVSFCRFGYSVGERIPLKKDLEEDLVSDSGEVQIDDLIADPGPSPEEDLAVREDLRILDGLIGGLGLVAQRVVRLRLEGYPLRMIAKDIGVSISRVEQISKGAIASMKRTIKQRGLERNA